MHRFHLPSLRFGRRTVLYTALAGLTMASSFASSPTLAAAAGGATLSVNDVSLKEGDQSLSLPGGVIRRQVAQFTLSLSSPQPEAISVHVKTADGTAIAGEDYVALDRVVTIPTNTSTFTVGVGLIGDRTFEPDETFFLDLSDAIVNISPSRGTATILNDDDVPQLSVDDIHTAERNSDIATQVPVRLSNPASEAITVRATVKDGSAVAGEDYTPQAPLSTTAPFQVTLTFQPGQTVQDVGQLLIKADNVHEPTEQFTVSLDDAVNAIIAKADGTVTVDDDDPVPMLAIHDGSVVEGQQGTNFGHLQVTLTNPTSDDVAFTFHTATGTASSGSDFTPVTGQGTIAHGQTSTDVSVPVLGDRQREPSESVFVIIDSVQNANLGNSVGELTIKSDDLIGIPVPAPLPPLLPGR